MIKKYVKGKDVLVLGATPEIRDLLAELKMKVTVLDISPSMVKAMTSLKKYKNKENIIIDSWLTARLDKKYDLVIGDSVVNNVPLEKLDGFFYQVGNFLHNDGVFICQLAIIIKPLKKINISINKIINKARKSPAYYRVYADRAYDYCQWSALHRRHKVINWGELNGIYRHKLKDGKITGKEFGLLDFNLSDVSILLLTGREFLKAVKLFWKIIKETYEKKHRVSKDFYRIYVLKKK